jgi:AraC-like DNA-binding protein
MGINPPHQRRRNPAKSLEELRHGLRSNSPILNTDVALIQSFEIQPSLVLRDFVRHYGFLEELHPKERTSHSLFPEHLTRLFFFAYIERQGNADTLKYVHGFHLQPLPFSVSEGITIRALVVDLFPWGAIKLLGLNNPISDIQFDLRFQKLSLALEHLIKTGQLLEAVGLLDDWLIRRLERVAVGITPAIVAARKIIETRGQSRIETLAETVGLSRRQLERGFGNDVGFSPKLLSRLIRFEATWFELQNRKPPDLTRIAFELGFADQSHLTREFQRFSHTTPGSFLKRSLGVQEQAQR